MTVEVVDKEVVVNEGTFKDLYEENKEKEEAAIK